MKALVIGGTGPTGPHIVSGLLHRGYDVAILNRGSQDSVKLSPEVEQIKADPHFEETLRDGLSGRKFDLVVASYGRLRVIAKLAGNYTNRLISIGGAPSYRGTRHPNALFPVGLQVPLPEEAPKVSSEEEFRFGYLVKISEDAVLDGHKEGRYNGTHLRYPLLYGPRQPIPCEWWVVRRILDGRKYILLPDGGLTVITRGYAKNMAHAVLLAVDNPEMASGKIYNCGDNHQFTMAQWAEIIQDTMGASLEMIYLPAAFSQPSRDFMIGAQHSHHLQYDTFLIRSELKYTDLVSPVEAIKDTVNWYLETPPILNEATISNLALNYRNEDDLYKIYEDMIVKLKTLQLADTEFIHPYAHPKKPGEKKDHLGR